MKTSMALVLVPVLCVWAAMPAMASRPGEVDPAFDAGMGQFAFGSGEVRRGDLRSLSG